MTLAPTDNLRHAKPMDGSARSTSFGAESWEIHFRQLMKLEFDHYKAPLSLNGLTTCGMPPLATSAQLSEVSVQAPTQAVPAQLPQAAVPAPRPTHVWAVPFGIRPLSLRFNDLYKSLRNIVADRPAFTYERPMALGVLTTRPLPLIVIITDTAFNGHKFSRWLDALLEYVGRGGGTAVVMSEVWPIGKPAHLEAFFAKAGLRWRFARSHSATFLVNELAVPNDMVKSLATELNLEAKCLENVDSDAAWYQSDVEDMDFRYGAGCSFRTGWKGQSGIRWIGTRR